MVGSCLSKQHSSLIVSPEANSLLVAAHRCYTPSRDCQHNSLSQCIHKQLVGTCHPPPKSGGCQNKTPIGSFPDRFLRYGLAPPDYLKHGSSQNKHTRTQCKQSSVMPTSTLQQREDHTWEHPQALQSLCSNLTPTRLKNGAMNFSTYLKLQHPSPMLPMQPSPEAQQINGIFC